MCKPKNYRGLKSVQAYIDLIRMLFFWKILCMKTNVVYKKIVFQNLSNNQKVITMLKGYEEGNEVLLCNTARFIHIMVQQYLNGPL